MFIQLTLFVVVSQPMPDYPYFVVGPQGVAWMLAVTPEYVAELAAVEGFPVPVAQLASGFQWNRADIERWIKETGWEPPRQ